jgi:ankyrin repeat protein
MSLGGKGLKMLEFVCYNVHDFVVVNFMLLNLKCLHLLQKIWKWAKENLTKEEINNILLLATDNMGRTAWHVATEEGKLCVLQKIWGWAKENTTREEVNNKLLLATNDMGKTAWHVATKAGKLEILQKLWK